VGSALSVGCEALTNGGNYDLTGARSAPISRLTLEVSAKVPRYSIFFLGPDHLGGFSR
jgi:hypothetical protein